MQAVSVSLVSIAIVAAGAGAAGGAVLVPDPLPPAQVELHPDVCPSTPFHEWAYCWSRETTCAHVPEPIHDWACKTLECHTWESVELAGTDQDDGEAALHEEIECILSHLPEAFA